MGVLFDPAIRVVHSAAPRAGESREERDFYRVLDEAHESYAMLRHLPPGMKVVSFLYALHPRGAPGPRS